ncbi:MAG: hypothetical protein V5A43_03680 [Haloarculaceae archaeon]
MELVDQTVVPAGESPIVHPTSFSQLSEEELFWYDDFPIAKVPPTTDRFWMPGQYSLDFEVPWGESARPVLDQYCGDHVLQRVRHDEPVAWICPYCC